MATLDPLFGIHADALKLQRSRMEVLAANIANADTPNYQARDIDFAAALKDLQSGQNGGDGSKLQLATTHADQLGGGDAVSDPTLAYRVPLQPSVDGNSVDTQVEQAAFADAAMHYQASLSFLDGKLKGLMTAITGQ